METTKMLAFDLGASSGRAILGTLSSGKLQLEEIHRFPNEPVEVNGNLYWDVLRLFHEIKQGILKCVHQGHADIFSIGVDTWGVDFGLLDEQGNLLGNPSHYRDKRTNGMSEKISELISDDELYNITGIEPMWFNTILQIYSMKQSNSPLLKEAKTLLLTPDLINYFLTGEKVTEYSIASTTQMLDAKSHQWSEKIIDTLSLPKEIFTKVVNTGSVIGVLSKSICEELGVKNPKVIATAGHDTQSAIAAVPASSDDFVYINSGTWSLMGIETDKPVINDLSKTLSFTNEGGAAGKITLLKNIMGLWIIQECKRQWDREGEKLNFAELEKMALETTPFYAFIDTSNELFISPGNMPERIKEYCKATGQNIPESKGQIVRCIAESLAMKYRVTVENLEKMLDKKINSINMIGGGIKDKMLCQFTSNATALKVEAGPVEATAIGNLMIQAMALGKVKDLNEIRTVVKASISIDFYEPCDVIAWGEAFEKYKLVISN